MTTNYVMSSEAKQSTAGVRLLQSGGEAALLRNDHKIMPCVANRFFVDVVSGFRAIVRKVWDNAAGIFCNTKRSPTFFVQPNPRQLSDGV
jgi:hypothetical protein